MAQSNRPQDKWRQGAARPSSSGSPSASKGSSKKGKIIAGALVLAMGVGAVAGLLYYLRPSPKPIFLSLAITEYSDRNFPVNAFAQQDSEALRKHFGEDSVQAFQSQEKELILRELNQLADRSKGSEKGRPIIVHFSANALVQDGTVFVIPGNGKAGNSGTWLRLDEVVEPLKRAQGERLLLLDLKPVVDARTGMLNDQLGEEVMKAIEGMQLPFQVVNSYHPNTRPVVSRELNRSAFGWFLDRAFAGEADGWNSKNEKDKRVSSDEVGEFARQTVFQFTNKLGSPQFPMIQGAVSPASGFRLLTVPQEGPAPATAAQAAEEYPAWLLAGWQERDRWRADGVHRRTPRTFRHLEAVLLRAESQWLGGVDQTKSQTELDSELRELKAIKQQFPTPVPPVRSLAQTPVTDKAIREADAVLNKIIAKIKASPAPKKEELPEYQALWMALREKPPEPAAVATILLRVALDERNEPNIEQLKLLSQTWESLPNPPRYVEMLTLRMITQLDPRRLKLWAPEAGTIPRILLAVQSAENAVALDGRCLPWIDEELRTLETIRRKAIEDLLTKEADDREKARKSLDFVRARYAALAEVGQAIETALTEFDETRLFLAGWAGFEAPDAKIQQELDALWSSMVGECRELQPLLLAPEKPTIPDVQLLKNKANDLLRRRERIIDLVKIPSSATAIDVQKWLAWPYWSAGRRATQLAGRIRDTGLSPVQQALQAAGEKSASVKPPEPDSATHQKSGLRRARAALDLLLLTDDPELAKLEALYDSNSRKPSWAGFQELGQGISRRWMEALPDRYRKETSLVKQERMGWAIHPFDLPAIPRSGDTFKRDAAAELRIERAKKLVDRIAEVRDQADAGMYEMIQSPGTTGLSLALKDLAREQLSWNPSPNK